MKIIKTDTILKNLLGEPLKSGEDICTIGYVVSNILAGKVSNPHRGYMLAKKFATENEVKLMAEDIAFIKLELENNGKQQSIGFTALAVGQAIELLDSTDEKEDKKD